MFVSLFDNEEVNLNELFDELNEKHFKGIINKIECVWNTKLRVCAGKCFYKVEVIRKEGLHLFGRDCSYKEYTPTKIELSKKLFENNDMDINKITRTLIHEMTHAYLLQEYNEPGHTQRFQDTMTRITGENINHRCHSYNVKGLRNKRSVAYWCPCGLTDGFRSRMPKANAVYTAKCCGGRVSFKKIKDTNNESFISLF